MDITAYLVATLVLWLVPVIAVTMVAAAKGLNGFGFAVAAVLCWPLALLLVAVTPRQAPR